MVWFVGARDVHTPPNLTTRLPGRYIYDKRFAFFPELSENMQVDRAAIQDIISNGFVAVALKNRDQQTQQWPRYFAGGAGNIIPIRWTDTKKSLLRRVLIAYFNRVPDAMDETLLER